MKIVTGKKRRPRRLMLYAPHKWGKTTWASQAPSPVLVCTEDGADDVGCARTELCTQFGQVVSVLSDLLTQEHQFKVVAIDTMDWLEALVFRDVAAGSGKSSIEDIPYGKGYVLASTRWDVILNSLQALRDQRGMAICLICHAKINKIADPTQDTYDRWEPDLHKSISNRLQEWVDDILFGTYKVGTLKRDEGFNRERTRAVGSGERIVYTSERPAWLAGCRSPLPAELPADFGAYAAALKACEANGDGGNIDGVVVDGSSKKKGSKDAQS